MTIVLLALAFVLIFSLLGYLRGVVRILLVLAAFLLAGILTRYLGGISNMLGGAIPGIPRLLKPLAGQLALAIILFLILYIVCEWILHRREKNRRQKDLPAISYGERLGGMVVGAVWGIFILLVCLVGISIIGKVAGMVDRAAIASDRQTEQAPTQTPAVTEGPAGVNGFFSRMYEQIRLSPMGAIVEAANPLDERVTRAMEDMLQVIREPYLMDRFRRHPDINRFLTNPSFQRLAEDEEIQRLINNGDMYQLLDNEKITQLLGDRELVSQLKSIQIQQVLDDVLERTPPRTAN